MNLVYIILVSLSFQMSQPIKKIELLIKRGELAKSIELIDSLYKFSDNKIIDSQLDSLKQVSLRTYIDFSLSENEVEAILTKKMVSLVPYKKKNGRQKNG